MDRVHLGQIASNSVTDGRKPRLTSTIAKPSTLLSGWRRTPTLSRSLSMSGERVWLFATWLAAHVESFGAATSWCCIAAAADVEVETNGVIGGCSGALANQRARGTHGPLRVLSLPLPEPLALSKPPPALGILANREFFAARK